MTSKTIYGYSPFASSIDNRYHYVYRITNLVEGKHYYGSRSSSSSPIFDLGTRYFGSPSSEKNKWIIGDQKSNRSHYKYKILKCFDTRKEATNFEVYIHKKFDVKSNPEKFYNVSNQTSSGFDTTNISQCKGTKWYVDPITDHSLRCMPGTEPSGYIIGTSAKSKKKKSVSHQNMKWYCDISSNSEATYKEGCQPLGWVEGRLSVCEDTKLKLSIANTGRLVSIETRKKLQSANTGRKHYPETRQHLQKISKNKRWYHNPMTKNTIRIKDGDILPEGYVPGRGKLK